MASLAIADYLRTQGLKLPLDAVQVAHLAAQTVINMGVAEIEHDVLWYADADATLAHCITDNDDNHHLLRQAYLALDSLLSRFPSQSAAVYVLLLPSVAAQGRPLRRLVAQGMPLEVALPIDEAAGWQYLASRSAQTGWLNRVDDVAVWLAQGDLQGGHHARCQSQLALPVYGENGRVLGVVYVEDAQPHAFDDERQIYWIGLTLGLLPLLQQLQAQWLPENPLTEDKA